MSIIEKIRSCSPVIRNRNIILKAFDALLEKSRTGIYSDNAENRRLKRVGQKYGSKKEQQPTEKRQVKQEENKQQKFKFDENKIKGFASKATDEQLKAYLSKQDKHSDVAKIAQEELQSRKKYSNKELKDHSRNSSEKDLHRTIKEHKDEKMRIAAHKELERRSKEEKPQKEKDKKIQQSPEAKETVGKEKSDLNNSYIDEFYDKLSSVDDKEFISTINERFKNLFPKLNLGGTWKKEHINILKNFEKFGSYLPNGHVRNNDYFKSFDNHSTSSMPVYAYYSKKDKVISLSDKLIEKAQIKGDFNKEHEFNASMVHELGHAVENKLKEIDKDKFTQFAKVCGWNEENANKFATGTQQDIERQGKFDLLTKYSNKSSGEAFAEYYSIYALNKNSIDEMIDNNMTWNLHYRGEDLLADNIDKNMKIFKWMKKNIWENEELIKALQNECF